MYDIIIIGAGPAGISAGVYAVSRGLQTLVIEKNQVGGTIGKVSTVTHYSGIIDNETGKSFADRMKAQALNAGVDIVYEGVTSVTLHGEIKRVETNYNTYEAKRIILANGSTPRKLQVPGSDVLYGKGYAMNAAKDAEKYKGKNVYVVGGADGAIKEALYLSKFANQLTIIHFEEALGCISEFKEKVEHSYNIDVRLCSRLHKVEGSDQVEALEIINEKTGEIERIEDSGCGIFIYAGATPNTELYPELKLVDGYIPVNEKMETSIPGVYAAGDITAKQIRQVATAVSDGAIAGIHAAISLIK